jgi:hypothetical protein
MSDTESSNFKDSLNEYFKLKDKFENELNFDKRKINNNSTLSKREKRTEYLKLMPKCINCKRPSKKGTLFLITYHPADDKTDSYRIFKVSCGYLTNPCNLNIEIMVGKTDSIDELIKSVRNDIKEVKDEIIDDKNKLLFGLITSEKVIENFDSNKSYLTNLTTLYENYLDIFDNITNNPDKKIELDDALVQSYISINEIKTCITKMNQNNNNNYAHDAIEIYNNTLIPLLNKIRKLKYSINTVFHDENTNSCRLIQNTNSISDLSLTSNNKVISFEVGIKSKKGLQNL